MSRLQGILTIRQHSLYPGELSSTSVNFLCSRRNFRQLLSTFCSTGRPSINFSQLSLHPEELSISINFPCGPQIICHLLSTFSAAGRHSINFHQISMLRGDLISTSVKFPFIHENFCQLPSTFRETGDLLSTSVNFLCF